MAVGFEKNDTVSVRSEISSELFQEFMVFVPGITQGNEDGGQSKI